MTTAPLERLDVVSTVDGLADFAVPCDMEDRHQSASGEAAWITWWRPCCPRRPVVVLYCTPCFDWTVSRLHYAARCDYCGHRSRLGLFIARWEPIDRRPGASH